MRVGDKLIEIAAFNVVESFAKFHGSVLEQFRDFAVGEDGFFPMIFIVKAHTCMSQEMVEGKKKSGF